MAPDVRQQDSNHGDQNGAVNPDTSAAEAALKAKLSRKRTKTGCLTCRKRRIKCGEERPVCRNCVKSKRHCEGYSQRVVFKPPTFDYRPVPHGGAHITFQAGPVPEPAAAYPPDYGQAGLDPGIYSQLRPRQVEQYVPGFHAVPQQNAPDRQHLHFEVVPQPPSSAPLHHPDVFLPLNQLPQQIEGTHIYHPLQAQNTNMNVTPQAPAFPVPVDYLPQVSQLATSGIPPTYYQADWQPQRPMKREPYTPPTAYATNASAQNVPPELHRPSNYVEWSQPSVRESPSPTWISGGYVPRPELCRPIDYQPPPTHTTNLPEPVHVSTAPTVQVQHHVTPEYYEHEEHLPASDTPTYFLSEAAIQMQDDDYYDLQSDEEMEVDGIPLVPVETDRQRTLNTILSLNNISIQDLQTRRYDTFIYGGILNHYRVHEVANPLKNAATARVFAHFISVTGPSLSVFERHPRNTSVLFTEGQIPFSQQGLWTYTMPMAALRDQGLLHAMLALASLHIARLQDASVTPSMQHYAWALKRIHHCVGHTKKRLKVTTIAASMLLGFYEIMTADHMKWNMHLAGSKQLFLETDFVSMMQQFKRMRTERASRQKTRNSHFGPQHGRFQGEVLDQIYDIDERVVSDFVGKEVRYGDFGRIVTPTSGFPPPLDLGKFEILKDLYWWYCKQDAYQSIVSGNPLLLDYIRWANCPPRAPLGKADAVYGSFDHLILLLGRIADFAARDRVRKMRQIEANGGQWRPAPGMMMPKPPKPPPPPTPTSATSGNPMSGSAFPPPQPGNAPPPPMPEFYGMAPPPRQNVQMPASYNPAYDIPTPQTPSPKESVDLQTATRVALEEYGRIRAVLHTFSRSLGDAFDPLTSEYQPPLQTPFGDALFYRSYDIGCLWAVFNMAMIVTIRSHPHMHPAAHFAAGMAAQETAYFANQIGRIAAGIVPGPDDQPLNPTLGSALCESCMPCFFAAVQYQDPHQRHATVERIFNIAKRTGWGTAELIANGCETAWVKAADARRGPPYERLGRQGHSADPRLNGSWERLDPNAMPDEKDEGDRRLVKMKANARLNWAIGIMGTEDDEK